MPSAQDVITDAYKDLSGLRPGQVMSVDVLNDAFITLNNFVDFLAMQRIFVYQFTGGNWVVLPAFANLGTSYTLAKGNEWMLRRNLANKMAPQAKVYFKIPEPLLEEIATDAASSIAAIDGVGPS